jgi:hypothetical protein
VGNAPFSWVFRGKESSCRPAKACLDKLHESIKGDGAYYFVGVGADSGWQNEIEPKGGWCNTWHQRDTCWKGKDYADARRHIAEYIAKLQGGK